MGKEARNPGTIRFNATIQPPKAFAGGDYWVAFPYDLRELYGLGSVPVVATIDKKGFRSGLWKKGLLSGHPYLWIPKRIRRRLRKAIGDAVEVCVALDIEQREVNVPPDLKVVLAHNRAARAAFNSLHRLRRGEYVDWINEAIRPGSRKRRIARAVEMLAQAQTLR